MEECFAHLLGIAASFYADTEGDFAKAKECYRESIDYWERLKIRQNSQNSLYGYARALESAAEFYKYRDGNLTAARNLYEQVLDLSQDNRLDAESMKIINELIAISDDSDEKLRLHKLADAIQGKHH